MLAHFLHYLFLLYNLMILARIFGSWIPQLATHPLMHFIAYYTDPYLHLFRRFIPPVAGVIDMSPTLALIALNVIESLIKSLLR